MSCLPPLGERARVNVNVPAFARRAISEALPEGRTELLEEPSPRLQQTCAAREKIYSSSIANVYMRFSVEPAVVSTQASSAPQREGALWRASSPTGEHLLNASDRRGRSVAPRPAADVGRRAGSRPPAIYSMRHTL